VPSFSRIVALLGALEVGFSPASPGPTTDELERAAKDAAQAGDVETAVTLFEQARAIDRRPEWNCNIAIVYYRAAGDEPGESQILAMHFFDRCLDRADELDPATRASVERGQAFVRDQLAAAGYAEVEFDLQPPDAMVELDDIPPGRLDPQTPVWLAPGEHQVRFTALGHVAVERSITVVAERAQTVVGELPVLVDDRDDPPGPTEAPIAGTVEGPSVDPQPDAPREQDRARGGWIGAGVGYGLAAAGLGLGVGFHVVARSTRVELADTPDGPARDELIRGPYTTQRALAYSGYGLAVVGVALGIGMTARALSLRRSQSDTSSSRRLIPGAWLGPEGGGVALAWTPSR
jgi:hypothetical protein